MILRFRSKDGIFRVNANPEDTLGNVSLKLHEQVPNSIIDTFAFSTSPTGEQKSISEVANNSIDSLGLKHGDLLFISYKDQTQKDNAPETLKTPLNSQPARLNGQPIPENEKLQNLNSTLQEAKQPPLPPYVPSEVDTILSSQSGKIFRPRDYKMCRHGEKGMCDYCMPLEPYDTSYQESHNIKHSSFYSYLRKLDAAANKSTSGQGLKSSTSFSSNSTVDIISAPTSSGSSPVAPLSVPDYSVNKHCTGGHLPWPAGICSKCQPSAITLQPQEFRMVDHVEFAIPSIVDSFIDSWRQTGTQRIGFLIGSYKPYEEVPLGIKAVVEAIFEPPQKDEFDGLSLTLKNTSSSNKFDLISELDQAEEVASLCNLEILGVVYTDLLDAGNKNGTVVCKRHVDSFFLSSLELYFAAQLQLSRKYRSPYSQTGYFSSRFITTVISGNAEGQIEVMAYQASLSAEQMVAASLIEPSVNPSIMLVKQESDNLYVPDVFYRKVNEYGREVRVNAKPSFPVEYLFVTLTHGFPSSPAPAFIAGNRNDNSVVNNNKLFPIENRQFMGLSQDMTALSRQLKPLLNNANVDTLIDSDLISILSDFHLLFFLHTLEILSHDEEKLLGKVATEHNSEDAGLLFNSVGWQTLIAVIRESS